MDDALSWRLPLNRGEQHEDTAPTGATARFGGDDRGDEPVLVAVLAGPVEIGMAEDALQEAGIPAYVKRNSLGPVYGLSVGAFGRGEVWVVPALAERARDVLIGIGVLDDAEDERDADDAEDDAIREGRE